MFICRWQVPESEAEVNERRDQQESSSRRVGQGSGGSSESPGPKAVLSASSSMQRGVPRRKRAVDADRLSFPIVAYSQCSSEQEIMDMPW